MKGMSDPGMNIQAENSEPQNQLQESKFDHPENIVDLRVPYDPFINRKEQDTNTKNEHIQ